MILQGISIIVLAIGLIVQTLSIRALRKRIEKLEKDSVNG